MNKFNLPNLGFGLGLRAKHISYVLEHKPAVDWFEVISENYMDSRGRARHNLDAVREHYPIVCHGVSLSIGSTDKLNFDYLQRLKNFADEVQPEWISDHLCWTGINGKNTHDLLPVPLTEEALAHVVERIKQVQDFLGRRILLENPSSYLTFKADHIPEYEFMAAMAEQADCGLLLDVNNVYVANFNHRLDPRKYIEAIPMERVVQVHLAGHSNKGTHIVDTHDGHVIDEVWELYKYAVERAGFVPSTMVEWDSKIPEFAMLEVEIGKAKKFANDNFNPEIFAKDASVSYVSQPTNHNVLSLQNNLQTAILSGNLVAAQPETWIVEKENFAPAEQLNVYVKGYRLRLFDILMSDYEVAAGIAPDQFKKLVREYIETVPSVFYDVSAFSAQFCEWLQAQQIEQGAKDMARLDAAISECYNLPESEVLTQADMANIAPEDFLQMQIHVRTAAKFLQTTTDVDEYMKQFFADEKPLKIEVRPTFLLVYRNGKQVFRLALEEQEFAFLQTLNSDKNLGEAMEFLVANSGFSETELMQKMQKWFARWVANGALQKL